jgi:hypothetical protein
MTANTAPARCTILLILGILGAASAASAASATSAVAPPPSAPALTAYLGNISDWIMTTGVGSNNITVNHTVDPNGPSHIFINGNLARVLLAAYKLGGSGGGGGGGGGALPRRDAYLAEGLRWCRSFTALQISIATSTGEAAGFWDTGYSEVYIADTGTAVVALALCHELEADAAHAASYLRAMRRFALFVRHGCTLAPRIGSAAASGACPPKGRGWVIGAGTPGADASQAGALGDGWYKGALNTAPYTISTATLGSCGLVELDVANRAGPAPLADLTLEPIARAAAAWLVSNRTADGRIPYTITPPNGSPTTYQPITYSAESFVDVDLRYAPAAPGVAVLPSLAPLRATCDWLVANQSADGSWGKFGSGGGSAAGRLGFTASGDAQRSPRALTLLQWCYQRLTPADPAHQLAVTKYANFLLEPKNSANFGVNIVSLPTGFVGLAIADLIQPWVTFRSSTRAGYKLGAHPLGFGFD